jgi:redox-sensitive bicupin YhaK (pirin superfamily)
MYGTKSHAASCNRQRSDGAPSLASAKADPRRIALLASGRRHGPITRFITPWNVGELATPFVFLDYAEVAPGSQPLCGIQPHSTIASLTIVLNGEVSFEDATGAHGAVHAGGFAWMKAAHGAWHGGGSASGEPLRVFQLWIALPPSEVSSPAASQGIAPQEVEEDGPVRVILGQSGMARSRIRGAPADTNCFHVRLRDGQRWRYVAPEGHNVTWLAVDRGGLQLREGERVYWEQIALFGDSDGVIHAQADGDTSFVLGSARRSPRTSSGNHLSIAAELSAAVRDGSAAASTLGVDRDVAARSPGLLRPAGRAPRSAMAPRGDGAPQGGR